ncbi:MAG: sensor domain-containing diguanylate cyclase [Sulfobacillus sp.]|nr:sensor domain-containing diguanylate cyclase [Sulfobacillus sp.]
MNARIRIANLYIGLLLFLTGVMWFTWPVASGRPLTGLSFGLTAGMVALDGLGPLPMERGAVTLSTAGYISAYFLGGIPAAVAVLVVGTLASWVGHYRGIKSWGNLAVDILSLWAASLVGPSGPFALGRLLLFAVVFLMVNHLLIDVYYWIRDGQMRRAAIMQGLMWDAISWFISLPLVSIFVLLVHAYPHRPGLELLAILPYLTSAFLMRFYFFTRRDRRENRWLADGAVKLAEATTDTDIWNAALDIFSEAIPHHIFGLYLIDRLQNGFRRVNLIHPTGDELPYPLYLSPPYPFGSWALATRRLEWIQQPQSPDRALRSGFLIPLATGRDVWGLLIVGSTAAQAYSAHQRDLAQALGSSLALAVRKWVFHQDSLRLAHADPVISELYNFRHLRDVLEDLVTREEAPFTLAFLDMDRFKEINDQYGHLTGDRVLEQFVRLIRFEIRPDDVLARYGGDEFILLLRRADVAAATRVLERIRTRIQEHDFSPVTLPIQASVGIATWPDDGTTAEELLRTADQRMYLMKQQRRDRVSSDSR